MVCEIVGCVMCTVEETFVERVSKDMCRHNQGYYVSQTGVRCVLCDVLTIR